VGVDCCLAHTFRGGDIVSPPQQASAEGNDMAAEDDVAAVVGHISATYDDRAGQVLVKDVIYALGHFLAEPGSEVFAAALNRRLLEVAGSSATVWQLAADHPEPEDPHDGGFGR
jgi:hypothetical protein